MGSEEGQQIGVGSLEIGTTEPDDLIVSVFTRQLHEQCTFGLIAGHQIIDAMAARNDIVKAMRDGTEEERAHATQWRSEADFTLWSGVHFLLVSAANVLKLGWPRKQVTETEPEAIERRDRRARAVRKAAGLSQSPPFPRMASVLRDHLEHFDSRLNAWATRQELAAQEGRMQSHVDTTIAPMSISIANFPVEEFRRFDPGTLQFRFLSDDVIDLLEVLDGLEAIYSRLEGQRGSLVRGLPTSRLVRHPTG